MSWLVGRSSHAHGLSEPSYRLIGGHYTTEAATEEAKIAGAERSVVHAQQWLDTLPNEQKEPK